MKRENNGEGTVLPDAQPVKSQHIASKKAVPKRLIARHRPRSRPPRAAQQTARLTRAGIRLEINALRQREESITEECLQLWQLGKQAEANALHDTTYEIDARIHVLKSSLARPVEAGPRAVIELDAYATSLLRDHLGDDDDEDPRDVVNGAVAFLLGSEENGDDVFPESTHRAKARRLEAARTTVASLQHHVLLSVHLSPEQMDQLTLRQFTDEANRAKDSLVMVAFPGNGSMHMTVDGKSLPLDQPLPKANTCDAILSHLNAEAVALVQRYTEANPWDYSIADIISGCLENALRCALAGQQEAEKFTGLGSKQFHDGAWGYLEADIFNARQRRVGERETDTDTFKDQDWWVRRTRSSLKKKVHLSMDVADRAASTTNPSEAGR